MWLRHVHCCLATSLGDENRGLSQFLIVIPRIFREVKTSLVISLSTSWQIAYRKCRREGNHMTYSFIAVSPGNRYSSAVALFCGVFNFTGYITFLDSLATGHWTLKNNMQNGVKQGKEHCKGLKVSCTWNKKLKVSSFFSKRNKLWKQCRL